MSRTDRQWVEGVPPALVVLFKGSESPMWDPELSAVLEAVEDRLEEVHVTTADLNGRGPTVADAAAAVSFMGASSAVVVFPREWPSVELGDLAVDAACHPVALIPSSCVFTVDGIVAAYEQSCALASDLDSVAAGG